MRPSFFVIPIFDDENRGGLSRYCTTNVIFMFPWPIPQ